MNNSFYACCAAESFVIIALLLVIVVVLSDYLKTIKNQLWKVIENTRPIDVCGNGAWQTVLQIRDDTTAIKDILGKDDGDESKTDVSGDVWALAPCPECDGPASMHYDHDSGDGYFVVCSKYSRHEGCRYSIVTGGSTRRLAATEWNRNVVDYVRKKVRVEASDA